MLKLVFVKWHDASLEDEVASKEDLSGPCVLSSAGILIKYDKRELVFAGDLDEEDGSYRCVTHIPRAMIRKVRFFDV